MPNSPDQSILLDVYQRLGGIEAKIDDMKSIRITVDNAQATAQRAEHKSDTNARDIEDIREVMSGSKKEATVNKRWLIGTIITTVLAVAGLAMSLLQ